MKLLAAHLFAHVAELDEANAGALDLEEWDWFRVDEQLAELGDVTSTTAPVPSRSLDVTSARDAAPAWFLCRGVGATFYPDRVDNSDAELLMRCT